MATGDTTNPEQVRFESNERLDKADLDPLTAQARTFTDATTRALLFSSKAAAGAAVGLVCTGGALTANPTGPSDGKARLVSNLFVAIDADGRWLSKPAGTTLDVTIPAGGAPYQVYAYFQQISTKPAKRRAIPVSPPYTEFTFLPNTVNSSSVGLYVRSGSLGSVVPADVVNGITTNLCFLGIVSNTAGAVTISSLTPNRLSSVIPPTTLPANSTDSGSVKTLQDLSSALAYGLARLKYKEPGIGSGSTANVTAGATLPLTRVSGLSGMNAAMVGGYIQLSGAAASNINGVFKISTFVSSSVVDVATLSTATTDANNGSISWSVINHVLPGGSAPQVTNNFGAYVENRRGVDVVDRSTFAVTIGDGVSTFGIFDKTQFGSDSDLLQAALTLGGALGADIVLKEGVNLTLSSNVTLNNYGTTFSLRSVAKSIISLGAFTISFATLSSNSATLYISNIAFTASSTGLSFTGGPRVVLYGCTFSYVTPSSTAPMIVGTGIRQFLVDSCSFSAIVSGTDAANNVSLVQLEVTSDSTDVPVITFTRSKITHSGVAARSAIYIDALSRKAVIVFDKVSCICFGSVVDLPAFVTLINSAYGAVISNCGFSGTASGGTSAFVGIRIYESSGVLVSNCIFERLLKGIYLTPTSGLRTDKMKFTDCVFANDGTSNILSTVGIDATSPTIFDFSVKGCTFSSNKGLQIASTGSSGTLQANISGCSFQSGATDGLPCPTFTADASTGRILLCWNNNQHSGFFNQATQNVAFGVDVRASMVDGVFSNNKFTDIQQSGLFNGLPDVYASIIFINAAKQRWAVTGNVVTFCGSIPHVGSNRFHPLALLFTRGDSPPWQLESGVLSNNSVGDFNSKLKLAIIERPNCQSLIISGNSFYTVGVNGGFAFEESLAIGSDSSIISGSLIISNNSFVFGSPVSGPMYPFSIGDYTPPSPAGSGKYSSIVIEGNSFVLLTGSLPMRSFIGVGGPSISVVIRNNIASKIGDTTTTPVMTINMADPTNFNENGIATLPASSVAFPQNINISRF